MMYNDISLLTFIFVCLHWFQPLIIMITLIIEIARYKKIFDRYLFAAEHVPRKMLIAFCNHAVNFCNCRS